MKGNYFLMQHLNDYITQELFVAEKAFMIQVMPQLIRY